MSTVGSCNDVDGDKKKKVQRREFPITSCHDGSVSLMSLYDDPFASEQMSKAFDKIRKQGITSDLAGSFMERDGNRFIEIEWKG